MSNYLVTGTRNTPHITSMDDASLNAGIFGNGAYILDNGEKLRAEMISANEFRMYDGDLVAQGRHIRIEPSDVVNLTIANGAAGPKRHDLVVARYEKDVDTGVESVDFVVIEGTPAASPVDPAYNEGDIFAGDLIVDFPIYRIALNGINIESLTLLAERDVHGLGGVIDVKHGGTGKTDVLGIKLLLGLGSVASENIVPIAKGGTGQTSKAAAKVALDILGFQTSNPAANSIQLKTADGSENVYPIIAPSLPVGIPEGALYVYKNLEDVFTAATGTILTATILSTMRENSVVVFTNDDARTVKISDPPQNYGLAILFKGKNDFYQGGLFFGYGSSPKLYAYLHGSSSSGWVQIAAL